MKLMMQAEIGHHIQYDYDITVASGGFFSYFSCDVIAYISYK